MNAIDGTVVRFEERDICFTVESLANKLKPEWIEDALRATETESVRLAGREPRTNGITLTPDRDVR